MSITEEEKELFREWKNLDRTIVPDGVVNEDCYIRSNPRIMLLLKEVNDFNGDLRELLRKGEVWQTWNNATRWVRGIRSLDRDIPWTELMSVAQKDRVAVLSSICAMNIKKTPGKRRANYGNLRHAVGRDAELLRRQFLLYDPSLVICCGQPVFDLFRDYFIPGQKIDLKRTSVGVPFVEFAPGKVVLGYYHPQALIKSQTLFNGLIEAVRELQGSIQGLGFAK